METNLVLGCVVLGAAAALLTYLMVWSRRTIDRIAHKRFGTAREIMRELNGDR